MTPEASAQGAEEAPQGAAVLSQDSERDWEKEAREQGWVPEEEFRGDKKPARFKTAQEYIEDGEAMTPHVRRLLDRQQKAFDDRLAKMEKTHTKTTAILKRQYDEDIANITAAQKVAAKAGDDREYDRLEKVKDQVKADAPTKEEVRNVDDEFAAKHDWYRTDDELTALAIGLSQKVLNELKEGETMSPEEMFDEVEKRVKRSVIYKAKFPSKTNGHAAVDGGSEGGAGGHVERSSALFNKLPPEARAQCAKDVKAGIYKTNEEWAKAYFD